MNSGRQPEHAPLYTQIVDQFLALAEADESIPSYAVKNLTRILRGGPPKAVAIVEAFTSDDDDVK